MVPGDEVQLPDLQVIQRYSLAVRGATAPTADVIAALHADLAWLTGGGRRRTAPSAAKEAPAKPIAAKTVKKAAPAKSAPARTAKKTAAKKTAAKKTAKRTGARRG